jgi:hypothetical protein
LHAASGLLLAALRTPGLLQQASAAGSRPRHINPGQCWQAGARSFAPGCTGHGMHCWSDAHAYWTFQRWVTEVGKQFLRGGLHLLCGAGLRRWAAALCMRKASQQALHLLSTLDIAIKTCQLPLPPSMAELGRLQSRLVIRLPSANIRNAKRTRAKRSEFNHCAVTASGVPTVLASTFHPTMHMTRVRCPGSKQHHDIYPYRNLIYTVGLPGCPCRSGQI